MELLLLTQEEHATELRKDPDGPIVSLVKLWNEHQATSKQVTKLDREILLGSPAVKFGTTVCLTVDDRPYQASKVKKALDFMNKAHYYINFINNNLYLLCSNQRIAILAPWAEREETIIRRVQIWTDQEVAVKKMGPTHLF
jgi:hypothetical protein